MTAVNYVDSSTVTVWGSCDGQQFCCLLSDPGGGLREFELIGSKWSDDGINFSDGSGVYSLQPTGWGLVAVARGDGLGDDMRGSRSQHPNYAETFYGEGGDDTIDLLEGDDQAYGGDGVDTISAGAGDDTVFGGDGNDLLRGNGGNDTISGEQDNDTIRGDNGADTLNGGDGNDTIRGNNGKDTLLGGDGNDRLYGGGQNDTLFGENDDDILYGGAGNDWLHGGHKHDTLYGNGGNDVLYGSRGNDELFGASGKDHLCETSFKNWDTQVCPTIRMDGGDGIDDRAWIQRSYIGPWGQECPIVDIEAPATGDAHTVEHLRDDGWIWDDVPSLSPDPVFYPDPTPWPDCQTLIDLGGM